MPGASTNAKHVSKHPRLAPAPKQKLRRHHRLSWVSLQISWRQPFGKARVEIADLLAAYEAACKARCAMVASLDSFGAQAKAFTEAAGIRVLSSDGEIYWCGVKLVA